VVECEKDRFVIFVVCDEIGDYHIARGFFFLQSQAGFIAECRDESRVVLIQDIRGDLPGSLPTAKQAQIVQSFKRTYQTPFLWMGEISKIGLLTEIKNIWPNNHFVSESGLKRPSG
jgi:hypothetical protein